MGFLWCWEKFFWWVFRVKDGKGLLLEGFGEDGVGVVDIRCFCFFCDG